MAYTAQNLEHAVWVFYSSEHSERAEAHKWLTGAQRCPEAWSFVWQLLQSQKGTEIQFFAATTLHSKLQRCWAEVPKDNHEELRSRILEAIAAFSSGPKIVLNRLCISLAAFLLQQGASDVLSALQQFTAPQHAGLLLEILALIPEEFYSMTLSSNTKTRLHYNLQQQTPQILQLVTKHLQLERVNMSDMDESSWNRQISVWQNACQCAKAWLELGNIAPLCCMSVVTSALQVLHAVYRGLGPLCRRVLVGTELETCEAALSVTTAAMFQAEPEVMTTTCWPLLRILIDAVQPILEVEDQTDSMNEELVAEIYTNLTSVGEHMSRRISVALLEEAEAPDQPSAAGQTAAELLGLILRCSSAPGHYPTQEAHSQLAFGFWYALQDDASVNSPALDKCLCVWYEQLAAALLRKSVLPTAENALSAEDAELMRCYRQDVADALLYCHRVLKTPLLEQLTSLLLSLLAHTAEDAGCQLEAVLHAFLALADTARCEVSHALSTFLRALTTLPYPQLHQQVLITALDCFSSYAEWLGREQGSEVTSLVGAALELAGSSLGRPGAAPRAALALRALCRDCRPHLPPHAPRLLQAIQDGQGLWSGAVCLQVLGAAGAAAAALPATTAAPYLTALTQPLVSTLQLAQKPQLSNNEISECGVALRQAAVLVVPLSNTGSSEGVQGEHARIPLQLLLPTLTPIAYHVQLTEALFHLIKLIITSLLDECEPLLPQFCDILVVSLKMEPHPTAIEVAKLISLMFPVVNGAPLSLAVNTVLAVCNETLQNESAASLSSHATLLDALFSALSATASKKSHLLQQVQTQMYNIIQLAILSISLPEQGPLRESCRFLAQLSKVLPASLLPQAPALVHKAMHCIGVSTPRTHIDLFGDLLWVLGRAQWDSHKAAPVVGPAHLAAWLREALQQDNYPTSHATPQVKEKFISAITKQHSNKRLLTAAVVEFALSSRGLIGEYGNITTQTNHMY